MEGWDSDRIFLVSPEKKRNSDASINHSAWTNENVGIIVRVAIGAAHREMPPIESNFIGFSFRFGFIQRWRKQLR